MLQLRVIADGSKVARTAVYLGQRAVSRGDAGVQELPERHLRDHVRLHDFLGAGAFGAAFACEIAPWFGVVDTEEEEERGWVQCVIKLPPSRLHTADLDRLSSEGKRAYAQQQVKGKHPKELLRGTEQEGSDHAHLREQARLAFCKEVHNAELMLEPRSMRDFRYTVSVQQQPSPPPPPSPPHHQHYYYVEEESRARRKWRLVGTPVRGLTEAQRLQVSMHQHLMRAHPGFHHMHRVLHLDRSLPAIISEKADGDLLSLSKREAKWLTLAHGKPLPALWVRICAQLATAFEYMGAHSVLSHVDLKPENVLYQWGHHHHHHGPANKPPTIELRCMLSDYGICATHDDTLDSRQYFPGTPLYNPRGDNFTEWKRQGSTMRQLSAFQFATTALDLLSFEHGYHPCDHCRGKEVIADLFHRSSTPATGISEHAHCNMPRTLVRLVTAHSTKPILTYMSIFIRQIKEAASVLNEGNPYYTTDVQERIRHERELAEGARVMLRILRGGEHP
jgi:hypothetical protein